MSGREVAADSGTLTQRPRVGTSAVRCSSDPSPRGPRAAGASACYSAVRVSVNSGGDEGKPGVWGRGHAGAALGCGVQEDKLERGRVTGSGKNFRDGEGDRRAAPSASDLAAVSAPLPAVGARAFLSYE